MDPALGVGDYSIGGGRWRHANATSTARRGVEVRGTVVLPHCEFVALGLEFWRGSAAQLWAIRVSGLRSA